MKRKFHVNEKGEVHRCTAFLAPCRFGGEEQHFSTEDEARRAYEERFAAFRPTAPRPLPPTAPIPKTEATFNSEGLTANMVEFRHQLQEVAKTIERYQQYRATGLNEDTHIPRLSPTIYRYTNKRRMDRAFQLRDYDYVASEASEAIRRFYMNEVFDASDVDCMLSDEDIRSFARHLH